VPSALEEACVGAPAAGGLEPAAAGVSTAFPDATDAALEMLRAGGNAVDAAVAAAWALSVCEPAASGLGGQTTLLSYQADGTVRIIDGHSFGPLAASRATVTSREQRVGHRACVIPSTPATLEYARQRYGVLTARQVLAPAIGIAETGYAVTLLQRRQIKWVLGHLRASDATEQFLTKGQAPQVGCLLRQPRLARTLRRLGDHGADDFYRGEMSRAILRDMASHGGLITREDLETCTLPVEREPLRTSYRGLEIVSAPPPGGGLQLLMALKLLEWFLPAGSPRTVEDWYDAIARATYASFREREESPLGPEDFTAPVRDRCLSAARLEALAARYAEGPRLGPAPPVWEDPGDTTHLTVSDRAGNVVALTQSIQSVFGAKVANAELGFVYNNYLATCPRSSHPYGLSSRCLPRSNAAPTLVLGGTPGARRPLLALGAAGSRRIISAIQQVISSVVDRGFLVDEAVAAPRVHALLGGEVWLEEPAASLGQIALLESHFLKVKRRPSLSYGLGSVQALQWLPDGTLLSAADPRRDGTGAIVN
jgi:gamma-glutamyltranspeptidase / glutathione hydrolase